MKNSKVGGKLFIKSFNLEFSHKKEPIGKNMENITPEEVIQSLSDASASKRNQLKKAGVMGVSKQNPGPDIKKEDLAGRIKFFAEHLSKQGRNELVEILNAIAYYGGAESIRWVFDSDYSEEQINDLIEMVKAPTLEDKEIF